MTGQLCDLEINVSFCIHVHAWYAADYAGLSYDRHRLLSLAQQQTLIADRVPELDGLS